MNRIIFDKTVENDPFTFGFVSQPEEANIVVPEKGIGTSKSKERSVEYKKNHDNCMQIVYNIIIIKKLEIVGIFDLIVKEIEEGQILRSAKTCKICLLVFRLQCRHHWVPVWQPVRRLHVQLPADQGGEYLGHWDGAQRV